ncbi:hypothetical protein ACT29H_03015 [Thermophagus sp. OGC60D27]|uniref:hypothetical protein n=1 Tax=Thermophagus sp. OGC60D27 TaxID=3458415 RepID=UPI004037740A
MKNLSFLLTLLGIIISLNSCNDEETAFSAYGDVVVFSRYSESGPIEFATAYYVYGNKSMQDVIVTTPNGNQKALNPYEGYSSTFLIEPADEDYSTVPPTPGTYKFQIRTSSNETDSISDILTSSSFVSPVNISDFSLENNTLSAEWSEPSNAEAYRVRVLKLTDDSEIVYYASNLFSSTSFELNYASNYVKYQGNLPEEGEELIFEVLAYQFEEDFVGDLYNIESISSARSQITWN